MNERSRKILAAKGKKPESKSPQSVKLEKDARKLAKVTQSIMLKNKLAREANSRAAVDVKNNSNQILLQKFEKEWASVVENIRPLSDHDFVSFDKFVEIMSLMYFTEPPSQQDSEELTHKQVLFEVYSNLY